MLNSKLEEIRENLEEIQNLEKAIIVILSKKEEDDYNKIIYNWKIKNFSLEISKRSKKILEIFKTDTKKMITNINSKKIKNEKNLKNLFFSKIEILKKNKKNEKNLEKKNLIKKIYDTNYFLDNIFLISEEKPNFNQIEENGKNVDLRIFYENFLNFKKIQEKIEIKSYLHFIRDFEKIFEIDLNFKILNFRKFFFFYNSIKKYLYDFFKRTHPLVNFEKTENQILKNFKNFFKQKMIKGFFDEIDENEKNEEKGNLFENENFEKNEKKNFEILEKLKNEIFLKDKEIENFKTFKNDENLKNYEIEKYENEINLLKEEILNKKNNLENLENFLKEKNSEILEIKKLNENFEKKIFLKLKKMKN